MRIREHGARGGAKMDIDPKRLGRWMGAPCGPERSPPGTSFPNHPILASRETTRCRLPSARTLPRSARGFPVGGTLVCCYVRERRADAVLCRAESRFARPARRCLGTERGLSSAAPRAGHPQRGPARHEQPPSLEGHVMPFWQHADMSMLLFYPSHMGAAGRASSRSTYAHTLTTPRTHPSNRKSQQLGS